MGAWAVDLALSVGIFPYVLKLLQTTASDLRSVLVYIWTKILALDSSCQADLIKDNSQLYFIKFLESNASESEKAMAMFVLSVICCNYPKGQHACLTSNLMLGIFRCLVTAETELLQMWSLLCLGHSWNNFWEAVNIGYKQNIREALCKFLGSEKVELRAAAVFAIGCAISIPTRENSHVSAEGERLMEARKKAIERKFAYLLIEMPWDASPMVRLETAAALSKLIISHDEYFQEAKDFAQHGDSSTVTETSPVSMSVQSPVPARASLQKQMNPVNFSGVSSLLAHEASVGGTSLGDDLLAAHAADVSFSDTDPDLYDSEREIKQAAMLVSYTAHMM